MGIENQLESYLKLPWIPLYTHDDEFWKVDEYSIIQYWALAGTIIFTFVVFLFEDYLDSRQKSAYQRTDFPKELEEVVSKMDSELKQQQKTSEKTEQSKGDETTTKEDEVLKKNQLMLPQLNVKFMKAQSYGLDKISFSMFHSTYEVIEGIVFLYCGFLPWVWDLSVQVAKEKIPYLSPVTGEIGISLVFLLCMTLISTVTSLPFELYSTFQIEKKHGFNKQTIGLFFTDKVKSLCLTFLIGGPFVALLLTIIKWGGEHFYIYVWLFTFVFSLIMMTLVPVFIMPLFNKYEPLKDGDLKDSIYAMAKSIKYPLSKLFVMDGSKRSAHSNAFMFGFGSNKRIVLYDTLLTQVHDSEILAILGHELGHWKLSHTILNMVISQVYTGLSFYCFSLCFHSRDLYAAFGFSSTEQTPTLIALLIFFQTVWAPIDKILSFAVTSLSRTFEFQADRFSATQLNMSKELQSGLCKIHLENLGCMCPDKLFAMYHYSHPHLVERLSAMMELDKLKKQS